MLLPLLIQVSSVPVVIIPIIVTQVATGEQWVEEHAGGGTIIFNKSNKWRPELGTYTFEVTGVRGKDTGIPERFVFTTEFFNRHTP